MRRYHGNQKAAPGVYFDLRRLSVKALGEDGSLPGTERDEYRRVPTLLMAIVGPFLGLLYVILMPVIGVVMLAWVVGEKVVPVLAAAAVSLARVSRPAWEPAIAFLSRGRAGKRRKESSRTKKEQKDTWVEDVKDELK